MIINQTLPQHLPTGKQIEMKQKQGYSLIEMLIVVAIFALLALVVTQSMIATLGESRKSEAIVRVRENLFYTSSLFERQVRNANSITFCNNTNLAFLDETNSAVTIRCLDLGTVNGRLTINGDQVSSQDVVLSACQFTCILGTTGIPTNISLYLEAYGKNLESKDKSTVNVKTTVNLRQY